MKREIKLRGLPTLIDKDELDYINFDRDGNFAVGFYEDGYIIGNVAEASEDYISPEFWIAVDRNTIGQYTGLHDKNGREIYESDILRVERNDDPNDFYIAPVSWCGGDYPAFDILPKYWPHRVNYDTNALSAIYAGWSEEVMTVIGNIYEDPDLLEAEK